MLRRLFYCLAFALAVLYNGVVGAVWFESVSPSGHTLCYQTQNQNVLLTGCNLQSEGDLVVPETVEYNGTEYRVVTLGNNCFRGCSLLVSITLPPSIENMQRYVFERCTNLERVRLGSVLPPTLTTYYTFNSDVASHMVFEVPCGARDLYMENAYWRRYNVVELCDGSYYHAEPVDAVASAGGSVMNAGLAFSFTVGQAVYAQYGEKYENEEGVQHLMIHKPIGDTVAEACDSFLWYGRYFTESTTARHTLKDNYGHDTIVVLHLTIHHSQMAEDEDTVCFNELPYEWNGVVFDSADVLSGTLEDRYGCDSVVEMRLTVSSVYEVPDSLEVCYNEMPYEWNGLVFESEETLVARLQTVDGCDSVVHSTLIVNSFQHHEDNITVCDSLWWRNTEQNYYRDTAVYYHYADSNGCPAIDTLLLKVHYSDYIVDSLEACDSLIWNGKVYKTFDATDRYSTINRYGCDSIVDMFLTLYYSTTATQMAMACDSFHWHGVRYIEPDSAAYHTRGVGGCDSTIYLHLDLGHSSVRIDRVVACDTFVWIDGMHYSESVEDLMMRYQSVAGCDSIVVLNLSIYHGSDTTLHMQGYHRISYRGTEYRSSGNYKRILADKHGCDSVVNLSLSIIHSAPLPHIEAFRRLMVMLDHYPNGRDRQRVDYDAYRWYCNGELIKGATMDSYSREGYEPLVGLFYVEVPTDESHQYWVRSNEIILTAQKGEEIGNGSLSVDIYPNPVGRGQTVNVRVSGWENISDCNITVYDMQGREMISMKANDGMAAFSADWASGVYSVVLMNGETEIKTSKLIVR